MLSMRPMPPVTILASNSRGRDAAVLSGLLGWWLYVILACFSRIDPPLVTNFLGEWLIVIAAVFALQAALNRLIIYCVAYRPPISLWGRIRTGCWIIRGHDHVYLAPLAIVLLGIGSVVVQDTLGVSPLVSISVTAAVVVWLSLVLGPSFPVWQLTGNHRLHPSAFNPRLGTGQHEMRM